MSLLEARMREPLHMGPMADADGTGRVGNPACGDVVTLHLKVRGDEVVGASFESIGSVYQLATASVLCDCVLGKTLEHARKRSPECVLERLPDLPARHRYLARLGIEALQRALADVDRRRLGLPEVPRSQRVMDDVEAQTFVVGLLENGAPWKTGEIEAMVQAADARLPGSTLRFLSRLRKQGNIAASMDVEHQTWLWALPGVDFEA